MPGSLTSRIRQLGPSLRGLDKNSCAVPKDLECKPTDSSSSSRDSRTSLSSSTMNTVGTSCVLITTRLNQKESQKSKCSELLSVVADQAPVDNTGSIVSDDAMPSRAMPRG